MKRLFPSVGLLLAGLALLSFSSTASAQTILTETSGLDKKFGDAVQATFPNPIPGTIGLSVRGGSGRITFYAEAPKYFGPKAKVHDKIEEYVVKIFQQIPELEEIEVLLPYDREIIGGTWTRAILTSDPNTVHTYDLVNKTEASEKAKPIENAEPAEKPEPSEILNQK